MDWRDDSIVLQTLCDCVLASDCGYLIGNVPVQCTPFLRPLHPLCKNLPSNGRTIPGTPSVGVRRSVPAAITAMRERSPSDGEALQAIPTNRVSICVWFLTNWTSRC